MNGYAIVDENQLGVYWSNSLKDCQEQLEWQIKFGWGNRRMKIVKDIEARRPEHKEIA